MIKLIKIVVGLLLVIILAVIVYVTAFFDANDYKDQITTQVEQQTGRDFNIDGDINVSVFPWVGLKVEKVKLGNAQGFSERDFAEISRLDVKVKLLPLLTKQVQVDKVSLHGLSVSLEVDKQGQTNWADLSKKPSGSAEPKASQPVQNEASEQPAQGGAALAGLAVNGIEFIDANIRWTDAQTETIASVSDLSLETSEIVFDEPIEVSFKARVASNQPEVDAGISLQTNVSINEELNVFTVDAMKLNVETMMPSVSRSMMSLLVETNAQVDLKQQKADLKGMKISALGATLNADLAITELDVGPKIKGTISTNAINARAVAKQLQIVLPPMANANSLSNVSMESHVEASAGSANLDKLKITLDKSEITGWVHVLDLAQPNVKYNMKMSAINLDDYMPPPPVVQESEVVSQDEVESVAQKNEADVEIVLPEILKTLALNGLFEIEKVTIQKIDVTDISIKSQAGSGLVRLKPISMKLLRGGIEMGVDINAQETPSYTIAFNANDLHAGPVVNPVLKGFTGDGEPIELEGALTLTADVKTQGATLLTLKKAAKGTVNFDMNQTSVTGVDIEYFARSATVDYLATKMEVNPEWRGEYDPKQTTAFRKIHATSNIANGKVKNNDFIMDSKRIKVTGKGEVDIVNNAMDYNALIDLTLERTKTAAEKLLEEPMGVHIHGPFEKLAIEPDTKRLAQAVKNIAKDKAKAELKKKKDAAAKKLKAQADKKKEEAEKKAKDKLKDKFKSLF